ncbi:hypothetical protein QFE97_13770 [Bacillus subtilis]|nr:hypothetical protein QFE97_13770 [Bacillus subtilis]
MFDLVRASILFKVDGDAPLEQFVRDISDGFGVVKSDKSTRLHTFQVAASEKFRQIVVHVELEVPDDPDREIEEYVGAIVERALNHSGEFTLGQGSQPGRAQLTQGLSQYAYA